MKSIELDILRALLEDFEGLQVLDVLALSIVADSAYPLEAVDVRRRVQVETGRISRCLGRLRRFDLLDDQGELTERGWSYFPQQRKASQRPAVPPPAPPPAPKRMAQAPKPAEPLYWTHADKDLARALGYLAWDPEAGQPYARDEVLTGPAAAAMLAVSKFQLEALAALDVGFPKALQSLDKRISSVYRREQVVAFRDVFLTHRKRRPSWPFF